MTDHKHPHPDPCPEPKEPPVHTDGEPGLPPPPPTEG